MPTIHAHAVTIACDTDDCAEYVQTIEASAHQATVRAHQAADHDWWQSYAGSNGGTFWRCPTHRIDTDYDI